MQQIGDGTSHGIRQTPVVTPASDDSGLQLSVHLH